MYQHAATNSKSTFLLIDEPLDEELKERRLNAEEKQLEFIVHSKATELIFFDAFILKKLIIAPLIDFCIKQALEKSSIEIVAEEENEKALLQLQFLTSKAFPDRQSLLFQAGPTDLKSFKSIPLPFRNLFLVKDLVKNLKGQLIFTTEPHDLSNSIQKIQFHLEIKVKRP